MGLLKVWNLLVLATSVEKAMLPELDSNKDSQTRCKLCTSKHLTLQSGIEMFGSINNF